MIFFITLKKKKKINKKSHYRNWGRLQGSYKRLHEAKVDLPSLNIPIETISPGGEPWSQYLSAVATAWASNIPAQWQTRELCADINSELIHLLTTKRRVGGKPWDDYRKNRTTELELSEDNSYSLFRLCWRQSTWRQKISKKRLKRWQRGLFVCERSFTQVTSIIITIYICYCLM